MAADCPRLTRSHTSANRVLPRPSAVKVRVPNEPLPSEPENSVTAYLVPVFFMGKVLVGRGAYRGLLKCDP